MEIKHTKITIGGLSGTGKGTVAKMLAEKLGFQLSSAGNFMREIAKEKGFDTLLDFQKSIHSKDNKDFSADISVDERTKKFAQENDKFVIEGRLCAHMIPEAFKIALNCSDEERFKRVALRQKMTVQKAEKETLERERLYTDFYKRFYKIENYLDESHYDLIIDTTNILPEDIVEKIINKLK
jgi:predicted cytidylate kinase